MHRLSSRKRQWGEGPAGGSSPFLLRNALIPSRLQIEGEAVKAFYRNGLMRAPTRAREISFTFTPRRVYRPLWSGDGGADSVVPRRWCTRQVFAVRSFLRAAAVTAWRKRSSLPPNRCLLPLPQIKRPRSPPNLLFCSRRPPLVGKETTSNKSCGSAGARAEGNGGGERAVHIGTTKG